MVDFAVDVIIFLNRTDSTSPKNVSWGIIIDAKSVQKNGENKTRKKL